VMVGDVKKKTNVPLSNPVLPTHFVSIPQPMILTFQDTNVDVWMAWYQYRSMNTVRRNVEHPVKLPNLPIVRRAVRLRVQMEQHQHHSRQFWVVVVHSVHRNLYVSVRIRVIHLHLNKRDSSLRVYAQKVT